MTRPRATTRDAKRARAAQDARAFVLAAAVAVFAAPAAVRAAPAAGPALAALPTSSSPGTAHEGFVSRRDVTRALFTAATVAIVSRGDAHFTAEASRPQTALARDLARAGEHFGNGAYSAPLLLGLWALGRVEHRPGLSRSALRIAGGAAASFVAVGGLKYLAGRWRPVESPDDPYRYKSFSHHVSFPSAHTAWAFALAAGADAETRARWVPLVAYPLAGLTAWSRVHDREHWASDVAAGAIVGLWAEHKFRVLLPRREPVADDGRLRPDLRVGVGSMPDSRAVGPVLTVGF